MSKIFEKIKKIGDNKFLIVRVNEKGSSFSTENIEVDKSELENEITGMEEMIIDKKDLLEKLKKIEKLEKLKNVK